jgi:F-type H+-transporting ATPase subunit a
MEGGEEVDPELARFMPLIVVVNLTLVAVVLVVLARVLTARPLTSGVPDGRQNLGEYILAFFVGKGREMGDTKVVRMVAPFLGTFFLLILLSNLIGMVPIPVLNRPPTSFFGVTFGLALASVLGTLVINVAHNGGGKAVKHLFWPNPMQLISEITDVVSLSLRLFGNIAGEYLTLLLVTSVVAVGIPLILHVLGFIPAFVQALVFTLLTTSFVAGVVSHESGAHGAKKKATDAQPVSTAVDSGEPGMVEPAVAGVAVDAPAPPTVPSNVPTTAPSTVLSTVASAVPPTVSEEG